MSGTGRQMSEMQISGGISVQEVKCPIFKDPTPLSFSLRAVRPSVRPSLLGLSTCSAVRRRRSIRPRNKSHEPHRQRKSVDVNIRSMAVSHTHTHNAHTLGLLDDPSSHRFATHAAFPLLMGRLWRRSRPNPCCFRCS